MRRLVALLLIVGLVSLGLPPAARVLGLAPDTATLPPPARAVAIGGGRTLDVTELGSGPPVVLVHGLPSNSADWGELPARLAARGHRVVVYDRIGYGHSSRADAADPSAYTYASSTRDLRGLLDALAIERAALVGWSYGGGVVQQLAAEAPERVTALVPLASVGPLLATTPDEAEPIERLARSPIGPALLRWVTAFGALGEAAAAEPVAEAFSGAEHVPPGWIARTAAQLAMPGTIDAWILEQRRADLSGIDPAAVAAPALVVHGTDDRLVPLAIAEDLARRLPRAELVAIEGGSHMLPATHADALAERIAAFLEETR